MGAHAAGLHYADGCAFEVVHECLQEIVPSQNASGMKTSGATIP
jgi:hypothetical protein